MPVLEIFLDIPNEIAEGLATGRYVRNAAGVIRWAAGTDKAGQVVCHLKEILLPGRPDPIPKPILGNGAVLLPMGALMVFQIAGVAFLGQKLARVESAIENMHNDVRSILEEMHKMAYHLYLEPLKAVAHGAEFLTAAKFAPALLEEARHSFIKARAEIRLFLSQQEHMDLLEHLPACRRLLSGLATSLTGEYFCLQAENASAAETQHVLDTYHGIFGQARQKLERVPAVYKFVPTPNQLRHYPTLKPLRAELHNTRECIEAERSFAGALTTEDRTMIRERLKNIEATGGTSAALVVYPA